MVHQQGSLLCVGQTFLSAAPLSAARFEKGWGRHSCLPSRGLAWSILYAAAWIALVWIIVAVKWWFLPRALAPRAIYVGISSLMFTFASTLILTALLARSRGYRLTGRQTPPHDR